MDPNFLRYYNVELDHIRQMAGEFAREYPKIAGRLALDPDGKEFCPDPFVERLLEGFAYLAARVHVKLDAEFPRFVQALLETVYPSYLAPTPSMAVIRFEPDFKNKALADGFEIPRGTQIRSIAGRVDNSTCIFRTAHALKLWPVRITNVNYVDRNLESLLLPEDGRVGAAIHLVLETTADLKLSETKFDELTLFLRGADSLPAAVMEHIFSQQLDILVRCTDTEGPGKWQSLGTQNLRPVGLEKDEALLPTHARTFAGNRLLMEYFAFPQRFLFLQITGFGEAVRRCGGRRMEVAIALRQSDPKLAPHVNPTLFDMFCTPVVNLFLKRSDRIIMDDRRPEFHIVIDRTRPLDFEIYTVESVTAYGSTPGEEQKFLPFYLSRDSDSGTTAFFTVNRRPRTPTEKERRFGRLSSYVGSETYLSLVDSRTSPYSPRLEQLGVTAYCTNRHLPLRISRGDLDADFAVEMNGPVVAARCIAGPTAPKPSFAMGNTTWRLISHLALNYYSLTDSSVGDGAVALRELLKLYVDLDDRPTRKQIDGVRSVETNSVLRRVASPGMITFARGLEIAIDLDEDAFTGTGVFLLGMVLEQFLARHVSINSFTETVIRSRQRGEIIRWPARTGRKPIL